MKKPVALALVALATMLAGCTTDQDDSNKEKYPTEAKQNFVDACVNSASQAGGGDKKAQRSTCECVIEKLEATLPYDRKDPDVNSFKDADEAIREGKELPTAVQDDFDRATADCRKSSG